MYNQNSVRKQKTIESKYKKVFNGHPPMFLMVDIKNKKGAKS